MLVFLFYIFLLAHLIDKAPYNFCEVLSNSLQTEFHTTMGCSILHCTIKGVIIPNGKRMKSELFYICDYLLFFQSSSSYKPSRKMVEEVQKIALLKRKEGSKFVSESNRKKPWRVCNFNTRDLIRDWFQENLRRLNAS